MKVPQWVGRLQAWRKGTPADCFSFPGWFLQDVVSTEFDDGIFSFAICSFTWKPYLREHSALLRMLTGELQLAELRGFCRLCGFR